MQGTGGKLDESHILVIAREVAKGLKAIHNCGIIHRDLKGKAESQRHFPTAEPILNIVRTWNLVKG